MGKVQSLFAWLLKPQALSGFVGLCLCVSAFNGLSRSEAAMPPGALAPLPRPAVAANHVDCNIKPCLALTFDDGPSSEYTPQILDILGRQQIKATFFIIGVHVAGKEALLRREYREGHEIGNHSWSHPDLSKLSAEDAESQIESTQRVIASAGVPAPKILRPPYGAVNDAVMAHNNLTVVRWNTDPEDWLSKDPAKITQSLMAHVRPGSIILMHDIYPTTVTALEPILQTLKQQYQFVTASQLLELSPGDQGQFFARFK
jgi:peptidoglycan-N-acetylglucosamine deacetylase